MTFKVAWENIQLAYKQPKYFLITIIISVLFYSMTSLLNNIKSLVFMFGNYSFFTASKLTFLLIVHYHQTIRIVSAITLWIISILLGVLFSLIVFKHLFFNNAGEKKKTSILAAFGAVLGALTPGCALCGVGIFYALGFGSAFITLLPFEGLEFSFIALIILTISVYLLAKNLTYCKVHPKNEK